MFNRITVLSYIAMLLLAGALTVSAQSRSADNQGATYTLTIHMTGFRNEKGMAGVLVFCSPKGWPETNEEACKHGSVPIHNGEATIKFDGLKAGTYAAAALHDENMNKKMDRNFFHVPKEGFGFPNNPKVVLMAPSYQAASFKVAGDTTIQIKMQYK